jgi:uncharacterized protein (TIGR02996 family)
MSDEEALIQEILANPNDANARLIYADWLDEHNDPRGAYLRQLFAAQTWDGDPDGRLRDAGARFDLVWLEQMHRGVTRAGLGRTLSSIHADFKLNTGQTIGLNSLRQSLTYAGLLMGTPSREINDSMHIEWALQAARNVRDGTRVHLIEPKRRDYDRIPGDMESITNDLHVVEWLPAVTCIGVFGDAYSELAIVWFQEEYALPIEKSALSQIKALDWKNAARHFSPDDF